MNAPTPDDELAQLLTEALAQAQPVPDHLVHAANSAYTWRTIDAELAQLVFDSQTDGLVGVRTEDGPRQITFEAPGLEIEVMVTGEQRQLVGQLVPPQPATIELAVGDTIMTEQTDDLGRFRFDELDPGPIRLALIDGTNSRRVQTEWVVI